MSERMMCKNPLSPVLREYGLTLLTHPLMRITRVIKSVYEIYLASINICTIRSDVRPSHLSGRVHFFQREETIS